MSQIFPRWTNHVVLAAALVGPAVGVVAVGSLWYFASPEFTDVGYRPKQPVPYSHALHVGELGLDCRYCHFSVEKSAVATVPPTQTCMNCHAVVLRDSKVLEPIRRSEATGVPMRWVRVHDLPQYSYFDHSAHVLSGVGCASCHGRVDQMEVVTQVEPLSMSWCLECHRDPDMHLRPLDKVTDMEWQPAADQRERAAEYKVARQIDPPEDCSGCHR